MSLFSATLLDLRHSLRQLRRSPVFTLTAILTLALGIGANTAMFSVVHSTLLAALPYPDPSQLVGIGFIAPTEPPEAEQTGQTADLLLHQATSFSSMGVADDSVYGQNLSVPNDHGQPLNQTVRSLRVSTGYLPTLGVAPLLGRTFTRDEDTPGAAPTALLSESLWRRAFNADPHVLGRILHLNGDPYTVIGVMPASFATVETPDLWQPLHLSVADPGYGGDNFQFIARRKPNVAPAQAAAELPALTAEIFRQFPIFYKWGGPGDPLKTQRLFPLQQIVVSEARPSLLALSAAVLAVLLMACLNLAGLITARSTARHQEIAVRSALGAGRSAVLRLLLTESILLALAGSAFGLLAARILLDALIRYAPVDLPQLHTPSIDLTAALFAVLAGCATTLIVGLLPALGLFRQSLTGGLSTARTAGATMAQGRLGRSLLVAQVALATALLSAGALLLGTFLHLRSTPSGVHPQQLFALQVNLKGTAYASSDHTQQFISAVEARLRALPGVEHVSTVNGLPLDRGLNNSGGPANHPEQVHLTQTRFITPGYFRTARTPLLSGNDISTSDRSTTQPVALLNERAARLWFPDRSPIGETILDGGQRMRVIGLVADVRNASLATPSEPTVYVPYAQVDDRTIATINGWFPTTFLLRTSDQGGHSSEKFGADLARAATTAVSAVDPEVPASKFVPMQAFLDRTVAAPRFFSWLAGAFAAFALLLTVIGLFGLLTYQVVSRTREIGVRVALGSPRSRILSLVLSNGLLLTTLGLVVGVVGSLALRQPITVLLASATRVDPQDLAPILASQFSAITVAAIAMLGASILASLIPARRAASVDPNIALRTE